MLRPSFLLPVSALKGTPRLACRGVSFVMAHPPAPLPRLYHGGICYLVGAGGGILFFYFNRIFKGAKPPLDPPWQIASSVAAGYKTRGLLKEGISPPLE